jgi:hypothetical protein
MLSISAMRWAMLFSKPLMIITPRLIASPGQMRDGELNQEQEASTG